MNLKNQKPQFPTLTTERLILRKLVKNDAGQLVKLRSNEQVNKYLDRQKTTTLDEALEFVNKIDLGIENNESYYWVISLTDDNKLIGTICLWNIDKANSMIEVGYELHPDFQGKGLMHEAFAKVVDYGFNILQFKTITAYLNSANERSIRLLEKNNFKRDLALENEYYSKGGSSEDLIYSLSL